MASQVSGRWLLRQALSCHHFKDKSNLLKVKYHTTTACLSDSHVGQKHGQSISATTHHAPVHLSHNAPSKQVPLSRVSRSGSVNIVELEHKISQLSMSSPLSSGLYLSPPSANIQYKLPAHVKNELMEQIIVDPAVSNVVRECPTIVPDTEIVDPIGADKVLDMPPFRNESTKQATVTNIIMIRRRKMRKHKLRKLRKRMKFLRRLILSRRKKKKRKLWEAHLETFKFKGLTEEVIDKNLARIQQKRDYMANYLKKSEPGLSRKTKEKVKKQPLPPPAPITPTPILPPGAMRR